MTRLPSGWVQAILADLGTWASGGTPSRGKPEYYGGTIPWIKTGELRDGPITQIEEFLTPEGIQNSSAKVYPPGSIAVAMYGATIGRVGILTRAAATNQACAVLPATHQPVPLLRFLFHYLLSIRENLQAAGKGGAQPNISLGLIKGWSINLSPLAEQVRIADALDSYMTRLDAAAEGLERVEANLKRYQASVRKAAVEGRLVPTEAELAKKEKRTFEPASELLERILKERRQRWEQTEMAKMKAKGESPKNDAWKKKYEEPAAPDPNNLPSLPEGWCYATGEQLFSWSSGEGLTQKNIQEGRYPVYGGNGVTGHHNKFVSEKATLIIGRVGALCGNVYLSDGPAWITDNAIYATALPAFVDMRFMRLAFQEAELNKRAAGSGQPFVNQRMLNETVIPLPPLSEHERIVGEVECLLTKTDALSASTSKEEAQIGILRQAILRWAFEGKLVDQDPNDEPASVLLERIRQKREPSQQAKSTKPERARRKSA